MRISADKNDPGYLAHITNPNRVKVTLDGEEVLYCITADDELGYILCHIVDDTGVAVDKYGNPVFSERYGKVTITY